MAQSVPRTAFRFSPALIAFDNKQCRGSLHETTRRPIQVYCRCMIVDDAPYLDISIRSNNDDRPSAQLRIRMRLTSFDYVTCAVGDIWEDELNAFNPELEMWEEMGVTFEENGRAIHADKNRQMMGRKTKFLEVVLEGSREVHSVFDGDDPQELNALALELMTKIRHAPKISCIALFDACANMPHLAEFCKLARALQKKADERHKKEGERELKAEKRFKEVKQKIWKNLDEMKMMDGTSADTVTTERLRQSNREAIQVLESITAKFKNSMKMLDDAEAKLPRK